MAIITFEGIAEDGKIAEMPDGYSDLNRRNFRAIDDDIVPLTTGLDNVIHSGEAADFDGDEKPAGFKFPDRNDDFNLHSGYFAAFNTNDLKVKVFGVDDGERAAKKVLLLDTDREFVRFGPQFDDIDEVRIETRDGTDPNPSDDFLPTTLLGCSDLFLNF